MKAKVDQEEINEILLKSLTNKKQNSAIGHSASNADNWPPKEESHKRKELEKLIESESEKDFDKTGKEEYNSKINTSEESLHSIKGWK